MAETTSLTAILSERAICGTNLTTEFLTTLSDRDEGLFKRWRGKSSQVRTACLLGCIDKIGPIAAARVAKQTVARLEPSFPKNILAFVRRLQGDDRRVVLVSGTPRFILRELCDVIEVVDDVVAPCLTRDDDGHAILSPSDFSYVTAFEEYEASLDAPERYTCLGSSVHDAYLMQTFQDSYAVAPDSRLREAARNSGWVTID